MPAETQHVASRTHPEPVLMPIEIRELHIRTTVTESPPAAEPGSNARSRAGASRENGNSNNDALVAECVEQVLEILQARKER